MILSNFLAKDILLNYKCVKKRGTRVSCLAQFGTRLLLTLSLADVDDVVAGVRKCVFSNVVKMLCTSQGLENR